MPLLRSLSICLPVLLLAFGFQSWADALPERSCAPGPIPSFVIKDFDQSEIKTPGSPNSLPTPEDSSNLALAAQGFFEAAQTQDPSGQCLRLIDAFSNRLKSGFEGAHEAEPANAAKGSGEVADYVITGRLSHPDPKSYQLEIKILDAKTSELMINTSEDFKIPSDAKKAGQQSELKLQNLLQTLRQAQLHLRDQPNQQTALQAQFHLQFSQEKIGLQAKAVLQIQLVDLDGSPLSNRQIDLQANPLLGLAQKQVTTDSGGHAQVEVTGLSIGLGTVTASYHYSDITHHEAEALSNWTSLEIGEAPTKAWEMIVSLAQHSWTRLHQENQEFRETSDGLTQSDIALKAWLKTAEAQNNENPQSLASQEILTIAGGGQYDDREMSYSQDAPSPLSSWTEKHLARVHGNFSPANSSDLSFHFQNNAATPDQDKLVIIFNSSLDVHSETHTEKDWQGPGAQAPQIEDGQDPAKSVPISFYKICDVTKEMKSKQVFECQWKDTYQDQTGGNTIEGSIRLKPLQ